MRIICGQRFTALGAGILFVFLAGALSPVAHAASETEGRLLDTARQVSSAAEDTGDTASKAVLGEAGNSPELSEEDSYILQPGDRIKLRIFPEDEYIKGGEMQISSDGNLTLPLAGKVNVGGLNVLSAQNKIAKIIDADYLVNPEVVIEVIQFKVHNFVILGEVRKPGTFAFPEGSSKLTLLQAISIAGGFSELANTKRIKIVRSQGGQNQVLRANAEAIISGNDPDIELKPDDVINVSQSLF